jgi:hypothetical protein
MEMISQQINTLFSVYAGNYINTGNKVADNVIMGIFTTIFSVFVSFIIFVTSKGGWRILMRRFMNTSPTNFNPESFPVPKEFIFSVPFSVELEVSLFCKWMANVNPDKLKKGGLILACGLANTLDYASVSTEEDDGRQLDNNYNTIHGLINSMGKALETPVPIWLGQDGVPVFAVKNCYNISSDITDHMALDSYSTFSLCSNSREAITEVAKVILSTDPELKSKIVDSKRLKVYQVEVSNHRDEHVRNKEIGYINPNKNFDFLFFEDKKSLMEMLGKFTSKGGIYPSHIPMENKLGILLHGPPGTGKSGVIQAIANYTKRHVVNIDLSQIKTCSALNTIMNIDRKTHMFVFEEIDTMGEVVANRKTATPKPTDSSEMKEMKEIMLLSMNSKPGMRPDKKQDVLTLGYLLQKIDGLISNEDTIFIATSNHPEKLDSAMLRPGRFGYQLKLSYCSREMLGDIIGLMSQLNHENKQCFMGRIPELACNVWSPAEIIQQCLIENMSSERMMCFLENQRPPTR